MVLVLNLFGRNAIKTLEISVDDVLGLKSIESQPKMKEAVKPSISYASLEQACNKICEEFPDLFKDELGCLKDFELDVKFKNDTRPVFHKVRPVPFAIRDDLAKGYEDFFLSLFHLKSFT